MTDLIAIQKIAGWEKLKTLVLDSVYLADYETRVQYGAGPVPGVVSTGAAPRLHQGHRQRLAGIPGGASPRVVVNHY
jgi:hypothetical protein